MTEVVNVSGKKIKIIKNIKNRSKNAFVYLDPPYYPVAKTKGGKISPYKIYNAVDYLPIDFLKLKQRCDELTNARVPFILSNSDCEFIRFLFRDYVIVEVKEPRGLKKGSKAFKPFETCLLITNFKQKKKFMEAIKALNKLR